jgi:hypothetical protein
MAYYLDLYSPATYEALGRSDRTVTGFRLKHKAAAGRLKAGDRLLCYMTRLSRWFGLHEVLDGPFLDETPLFYTANDPFVVRFHIKTRIWLPVEKAVPIKEDELWRSLSFTKGYDKSNSGWAQAVKGSLRLMKAADAAAIEAVLSRQAADGNTYPYGAKEYAALLTHTVPTPGTPVTVTVPPKDSETPSVVEPMPEAKEVRESIKIQALLAEIGSRMGLQIWLPKADRTAVLGEWKGNHPTLVEHLPFSYDDATIKTIEQIDVLWIKGKSIRRAFEVEHTTSIYSGLLRMADLMALQPDLAIMLHIVAPESRRDKVFQEIQRPVFSLLENHPLAEICSYISYDSVRELAKESNLEYLSDKVLEKYEESALADS